MIFIVLFIKSLLILLFVLLSVALMTVLERKYLSSIQRRRGRNVIGLFGLGQAVGDGIKLILKEGIRPMDADKWLILFSPILVFTVSLGAWGVVRVNGEVIGDVDLGLMYLLALTSLGVYGVMVGGYSSNSKYSIYGGIRSSAQMISYEVSSGILFGVLALNSGGSFRLTDVFIRQSICWNFLGMLPVFLLILIVILAETNRHPIDLREAESELVSGYNVEYSGGGIALIILGEYSMIVLTSTLVVVIFFGGYFVGFKSALVILFIIWARGAYRRFRYDQLMFLGWRSVMPFSVAFLVILMGFVVLGG